MEAIETSTILNRIGELKNQFSGHKLTAEEYTDEDTGFLGVRILDDADNTVAIVEPQYSIVDGVAVEHFSPASIIAEIEVALN